MKVLVVHDARGTIVSAGIVAPGAAASVQLIAPEGQQVSEIDVPDLEAAALDGLAEDRGFQFLEQVAERWRLDTSGKAPKLVPTTSA